MSWDKDPVLFSSEVTSQHKLFVGKVGLSILNNLVMATPVKTGRARNNWIPSVGDASEAVLDEPASPAAAIAQVMAAGVKEFNVKTMPDFPVLWMSNNLPYIGPLNNGSSIQAAANFVETAVLGVTDGL